MSDSVAPFTVVEARVDAVERVSPSFMRVSFTGPGVDGIGTPGQTFDQRIKLIFPGESGVLPDLEGAGDDWYTAWLAVPEDRRGSMRTYSIRDLTVDGGRTRLVVDFVLHLAEGATGPASRWAAAAQAGDALLLVAPRRDRLDGGGIEFDTSSTGDIVLAGDETAAPAIARILEDLDPATRGTAFIEIPEPSDELHIHAPRGVSVRWLSRAGGDVGSRLIPTVLEHLDVADTAVDPVVETEDLLWETPVYSGSGEAVSVPAAAGDAAATGSASATRFWIAGESRVITTLRRHLVRDLGIPRSSVAFMGYWRIGVAMKG